MGRCIGVFGGSFDPIHLGHLSLVSHSRSACGLARVILVPVGDPPHKSGPAASADHRLAMLDIAAEGEPGTSVSRIELDRPGKSYTVDTLEALKEEERDGELLLLIGADNAIEMETWHDPDRVLALAQVTVVGRPGSARSKVPPDLAARMTFIDGPMVDCSSTEVRRRIAAGEAVAHLVPPGVAAYIEQHELYKEEG